MLVEGQTSDVAQNAVFGHNDSSVAPSGGGVHGTGVFGLTVSPGAAGVFGANNSVRGVGVQGNGPEAGISGFSETGDGVRAHSNHGNGVSGFAHDANGTALLAINDAKTAPTINDGSPRGCGVLGVTTVPGSAGLFGANNEGHRGVGVQGNGPEAGVSGFSETGDGVRAHSNHGNGVSGFAHDPNGTALLAINDAKTAPTIHDGPPRGCGVLGVTTVPGSAGVFGANNDPNKGAGIQGNGPTAGVSGFSPQGPGVLGQGIKDAGVTGFHGDPRLQETTVANDGASAGVFGASDVGAGVVGYSRSPASFGVIAFGGIRASAIDHPLAGEFNGAVQVNGNVTVTGDVFLPGADCAEHFDVTAGEHVDAGAVVVIDSDGRLRQSHEAYDRRVAGVVSGAGNYRPALILDQRTTSDGRVPIALVGKVYCKVDARYSPIEAGDLLTSSTTPGHAMASRDPLKGIGSTIGKALAACHDGCGLIPILVTLR